MLASRLIGQVLIDAVGRPIGRIYDILFDSQNYELKYIVTVGLYVNLLKIGLLRRIVPADLLVHIEHAPRLRVVKEYLDKAIRSLRYKRLRSLEKAMRERDILALIMFIPLISLLLYLGIIYFFTIYGQILLWTGVVTLMYLPVLILEVQYIYTPELSLKYIYKKKVFDMNNRLLGIINDFEVDNKSMKIVALTLRSPGYYKVPSWLARVYEEKGFLKFPVSIVQSLNNNSIIVKLSLDELRDFITFSNEFKSR